MARSLLVIVSLPGLVMLGRGDHGVALLMCHSSQPPNHPHLLFCRPVCLSIFLINGEALLLTGLCLIWFRVTIFSSGHTLTCSVISHMTSLFLVDNRQHRPVCAKIISSWVRKVLYVAKAHVSRFSLGVCHLSSRCFPGVHLHHY